MSDIVSLQPGSENSLHELEFAVRRDKADRPIAIEFAQSHALMELTVVQLDSIV